tara:strand:- start:2568 stop:3731 length:1164 start_codon:yes stop_codon:yes gene_type:complete
MLFAIKNISDVNEENVALGNEVDNLTFQKDSFQKIAEANNDPQSLGPINIELTLQISELEIEKSELEKEIKRLNPEYISENDAPIIPSDDSQTNPPKESLIAGNCIDKTFWRQCAEWAWPIESEPEYEYLFDIGMCSSGDIVVIESERKVKREIDFILVDGASVITDKRYIARNEIKSFISLIHDESLDFKVEQTQHVARLINLESIDTDLSRKPRLTIQDHMKFDPYTMGTKKYKEIKERFPENACNNFKSIKPAIDIDDIFVQPSIDILETNTKSNISSIPDVPNIPKLSKASFEWNNDITCVRASGKRTSGFNATFNLLVTSNSRVKVLNYAYDQTNRNNRLLMLDAKASIERQRKNIKPAMNSENPEDNKLSLTRFFPKDICR